MKSSNRAPVDPRLLQHIGAARRYIAVTAVTGLCQALLIIGQVILIAHCIAPVITDGASFASRQPYIAGLLAVIAGRFLLTTIHERFAHRAADQVVQQMRARVLTHCVELGPRALSTDGSDVATLITQGLEDLRPYFVRYIPQLILAATVTPAAVAVILFYDWVAALTVIFTIPLIPVFMALVGWMTQSYSTTRLAQMRHLNAEVIDLLAGLPTLRGFNRERGPLQRVRRLAAQYTRVTMQTLKVAFLSGAVLEFLTTISVALVAVGVGMRLVNGLMDLLPGLVVIMLAPEAFQPLRQVGAHFHASADGLAAVDAAFQILDRPLPQQGARTLPAPDADEQAPQIRWQDVSVTAGDRHFHAPAGLTGQAGPGEITALIGPSGAGKTTAVMTALGVLPPTHGRVEICLPGREWTDLATVDAATWHTWCTWVPQRPALPPGRVLDFFPPEFSDDAAPGPALQRAAEMTGLSEVIAELPDGWLTRVGHGGLGLSVGQRQRLALTRALVAPAPVMFLDEPSAHLDAASEEQVINSIRYLRDQGCTVVVVAHRPTLMALADQQIHVESREVAR